ncbi:MAG: glycosyltransferase [Clostridia bacterium]|nr:glycosyltransferase [Clostridia bacterium]
MIHVVQVLTDTNIGGAGKYLLNYLQNFDRSSFRVTVILPENSQLAEPVKACDGVTLEEVPYMADQSYNKHCVAVLKELFIKIKPDILHTHACLSARIAGRKSKVPVILATRHCIEPLSRGIKALIKGFANTFLCDYYIAVSQAVVQNLTDSGIKPDKIKLVNNGVVPVRTISEDECRTLREAYHIQEDDTVFGVFARLEPVKGHKYFIKAARQYLKEESKAKFLIVGNGSLESVLKEQVARYGLEEHVIFTGFVPDTAPLLNITDITVISSESEAMSLAILEAMSLGKPSIATAVGGNTELIENDISGLLTGYADSASLASAMLRLANNPTLSQKLGQCAKEQYERNFTVERMVSRLEELYREVLRNDH